MLIERGDLLEALCGLATRAGTGHGALALVSGEAGIGKTSLLAAFRERVAGQHQVAWGSCEALFTPQPLGPLHDMSGAFTPRIRALLGNAAQPSSIFHAVLDDIARHGGAKILVFEDVHWADHATLDLLKFLGRRIPMCNALLVLSYRDDEIAPGHRLNAMIGDLPQTHVHRLPLQRLTREGVARMDEARAFEPDRLLQITGGNPFFITELLAAHRAGHQDVPASVKDSVNARLNRLSARERTFLETMSVVPAAFGQALISQLFGPDGETLAMACVGRGLLVESADGRLRFRHELARLATLSRLGSMQVQAVHGRMLEAMETLHAAREQSLDLLVHHAAGALDGSKVFELAPEAARIAASMGAHREAAAHLATALRFVDEAEPALAAQLHESWAYEAGISLQIDDEVIEARRHAITLWRALGRTDKVGDNLRWLSRLHWYRGEAAKANRFANEAVRVLEGTAPSGERAMAYSFRAQLHMLNDRMPEAIEWGERALALANQIGHVEAKIHALNNVGTARAYRDDEQGVAMLEESLALALAHGFHEHAARVYTNLGGYAVDFRRFALAEKTINDGIAFDTRNDLDAWTHYLVGVFAQLKLEQGRLADAERIAKGVLQLERLTLLMKLPARAVLSRVMMRRGSAEAAALLATVLDQALATEEAQYIIPARLALVEHAWLQGSLHKAHEQLALLAAMEPTTLHSWHEGELQVWASRTGFSLSGRTGLAVAPPFRAELEHDGPLAARLWSELGAPCSAAITLMATAKQDAATHLATAIRHLVPTGADGLIARARKIAAAHGIEGQMPRLRRGPYSAARSNLLGLTKREQEILGLMAAGATNRDIAGQLSRSQRTVEHHVSALLSKLNVGNRFEAMMRIRNEPWILEDPVGDGP